MFGLAFSNAGMMVWFSTSVCALLPPLPYVPQNVNVTGPLLADFELEECEQPTSASAANSAVATGMANLALRFMQRLLGGLGTLRAGPALRWAGAALMGGSCVDGRDLR